MSIKSYLKSVVYRNLSRHLKIYLYNMEDKNMKTHLDKLEVLHKSEHFLVVNKDFDVVINDNDEERLSLCKQVAHKYPSLVNTDLVHGVHIIHRLDYSTSGVTIFGVHKQAVAEAAKLFEKRKTKKFYLAVVRGHVSEPKLDINLAIGKDSRPEWTKLKMCTTRKEYCEKPRNARTRCLVLQRGNIYGDPATKVLLAPITGRRHQLRVHLQEIGHTIVGDYTYSDRTDLVPYRMFLHAFRLTVPSKLEHIDVQTEDPFTEANALNRWTVEETLHEISEGFQILYDETLPWCKIEV